MNPFSQKNSVLILDNTQIYHNKFLVNFIESIRCKILFLSLYSSDLNPIEIAFFSIKNWLKKNRNYIESCFDFYFVLTVACAQITPIMTQSFFQKSLYL